VKFIRWVKTEALNHMFKLYWEMYRPSGLAVMHSRCISRQH